jgi:hypothetical protein
VPDAHPIQLVVSDDMQRSRVTVFFRLILAIPQFIWAVLFGIAAELAIFVAWFAALFTGRVPEGLHGFIASYLRYLTRLTAYLFLLADPYPPFGGEEGGYPVDVRIAPAAPQNRLITFFRLILAIPGAILAYVFRLVNQVIAFLGWFVCVFTGQMNPGMARLSARLLSYEVQLYGYTYLLTDRYPSLSEAAEF